MAEVVSSFGRPMKPMSDSQYLELFREVEQLKAGAAERSRRLDAIFRVIDEIRAEIKTVVIMQVQVNQLTAQVSQLTAQVSAHELRIAETRGSDMMGDRAKKWVLAIFSALGGAWVFKLLTDMFSKGGV